jgi:hypothetical protein
LAFLRSSHAILSSSVGQAESRMPLAKRASCSGEGNTSMSEQKNKEEHWHLDQPVRSHIATNTEMKTTG